jgi:hypothetical protein
MPMRHLPVVPDLDQLKHQAKDLLRALHHGDSAAVLELREFHPDPIEPQQAKLSDAQHVLALSYHASSWPRLVQGVQLVNAIWKDDLDTVRDLVTRNPALIHEDALIKKGSNWGPPLTFAANVGRDRIIQLLYSLGARDLHSALDRAALQGKIGTARMLHAMAGAPLPADGALDGTAFALSASGTALMLEIGAKVVSIDGERLAPVDVVLETEGRKPQEKHAILEMYAKHGLALPDTAPMALHRGRIDLLEQHLKRDPFLINRTYTFGEIFPYEMGCRNEAAATVGTPLGGTTLLHMAVDYDEMEIAQWLLDRGADVNTRSAIDANGFGGYTALFSTVVSQPNFWMNLQRRSQGSTPFAQLFLERGANPNIRASIWKQAHPDYEKPARQEYRDVTPLGWGRRFEPPIYVNQAVMQLIREAGGVE